MTTFVFVDNQIKKESFLNRDPPGKIGRTASPTNNSNISSDRPIHPLIRRSVAFSLGCLTWLVFVLLYGNQSLESKFIRNDVADYLSTRPSVISEQPLEKTMMVRVRTLETSEEEQSQTKPTNHIEKEGSEVGVRTSKMVSTNKTNSTEQIKQKEERPRKPKLKHKIDVTNKTNSTEQTKQKEGRPRKPKSKHKVSVTNKTTSTEHECPPRPPTAQKRHSGVWVQIDEYTVTKALTMLSNDREYLHEKMISQMLSPYPNFVTLLSWDDKCRTLVFERLFPAKGWPKRMQPRLDDFSIVEKQIEEIWKVFEELSILPSQEFLMGLNNIMIGTTGNVTMFDFHTYHLKSSPHKRENPPFEYNQTKNNEFKDRLLSDLREKRESNRF